MKREQGLLLVVAALVALLGYRLLRAEGGGRQQRPTVLPLELGELPPARAVAELAASATARDPFRARRDTEPLPPIELPLPELPELPVLLPPPVPDAGPSRWSEHLFLTPAPPPGAIAEVVDTGDAGGPGEAETGSDAPPPAEAGSRDGQGAADYAEAYDEVKIDPFTVRYGRIVDPDRYDKKNGDPITFEEVDPRSGRVVIAARRLEPGSYESFRFASTLRNSIELEVRALPVNPGTVPRVRELVAWLLEQGDAEAAAYAHAERLARRGVELAGDDLESWMLLGTVFERTFRFDMAFAMYAQLAGEALPGPAPALGVELPAGRFARASAPRVRMALLLRRLGLDHAAEPMLRAAVALNDGSALAPLELGALLLETGRAGEAVALLERARGMADRSSPLAWRSQEALGRAHLRRGDYTAAASAFRDAGRAAAVQQSRGGQRDASAGVVAAAYLAGDFALAAREAAAAVADLGPDSVLLYLRGIAAAAAGEPAGEVLRDLRAAAAAAPLRAAAPLAALAFWLDMLGHPDLAQESLGQALEQEPSHIYGLYLRALWARRAGDLDAAAADLQALTREDPDCAAVLAELGWLLHQQEKLDGAEVMLRRAEQRAPLQAGIAVRRGFNLLRSGELEAGRAALQRAIALDPALYPARNAVAWAAYAEGDLSTAVAEFGEVADMLRDQPEHPQRLFAEQWQQRIQAHALLQRWQDPFEGRNLLAQWDAQSLARLGVEPRVEGGQLQFQGNHSGPGMTRVSRAVRALDFRSFAIEVAAGADHRGNAGVMLALETKGAQRRTTWSYQLYRDREGVLRYLMEGVGGDPVAGALPRRIAAGSSFRVQFVLDREQRPPLLTVSVDGASAWSGPVSALISPAGDLALGAYVETSNALPVSASVDNAELIYAQPQ